MSVTRKTIEPAPGKARGRIDAARVDATGEADIARQAASFRNWELGKRSPTGAAKALLRLFDNPPQLAPRALR